jgi:GT2 family glycosyltransferase
MYSDKAITALIPTFHRPEGLRKVLQSLCETAPEVKIVVAIEPDDPQAAEISAEFNADIAVCQAPRLGCSNAWNEALRVRPDDDIYVIAADDCIFKKGWLREALKALKKLDGSGLVAFKSGNREDMGDHYLMTRDFMIQHHGGVAAIPHYTSWCLDDEAQLRAKRAGKWIHAKDAVVVHNHPKHSQDACYVMGRELRDHNRAIYHERQAAGWPDDFEPILRDNGYEPAD